jgi:sugar O-acyltransferase (sialic acid O-acetyltransferase NeuD family)
MKLLEKLFQRMRKPKHLYIYGSGGLAKEIYGLVFNGKDAFTSRNGEKYEFAGYIDDNFKNCDPAKLIFYSNDVMLSRRNNDSFIVAIGDSSVRERIAKSFQANILSPLPEIWVFDPSYAPSSSRIGVGSFVFPFAVLTANSEIGRYSIVYSHSIICHDTKIGDFCTICPSVSIAGRCKIGNRVFFGIGSSVSNDIEICDDVTIGAGAVVVENITQPGVYVGCPARKLK